MDEMASVKAVSPSLNRIVKKETELLATSRTAMHHAAQLNHQVNLAFLFAWNFAG
jgi:hypothetical protein